MCILLEAHQTDSTFILSYILWNTLKYNTCQVVVFVLESACFTRWLYQSATNLFISYYFDHISYQVERRLLFEYIRVCHPWKTIMRLDNFSGRIQINISACPAVKYEATKSSQLTYHSMKTGNKWKPFAKSKIHLKFTLSKIQRQQFVVSCLTS